MSQVSIIGNDGKPILYAYLTAEGKLFLPSSFMQGMRTKVITSSTTLLNLKSFPLLPRCLA